LRLRHKLIRLSKLPLLKKVLPAIRSKYSRRCPLRVGALLSRESGFKEVV
jgi:hypothetical protein